MALQKVKLEQLQQLTEKIPYYMNYVLPEIICVLYLEDVKPFSSFFLNGKQTKFHKLLKIDTTKNCLFVRPVDELNPFFDNKERVSIDSTCICGIQLLALEKNIKSKNEDQDEEQFSVIEDDECEMNEGKKNLPQIFFNNSYQSYPFMEKGNTKDETQQEGSRCVEQGHKHIHYNGYEISLDKKKKKSNQIDCKYIIVPISFIINIELDE